MARKQVSRKRRVKKNIENSVMHYLGHQLVH